MKRSLVAVGLVIASLLAGQLTAGAASAASGSVVAAVSAIDRDSDTGYLTYTISAAASGLNAEDGICGPSGGYCEGFIEAKGLRDLVHQLTPAASFGNPTSSQKTWTGAAYYEPISAIRAHIFGSQGDLAGDWVPVQDFYPTTDLRVVVKSLTRATDTGYLNYDVDFSASKVALPDGVCGEPFRSCEGGVEARFESDDSVHLLAGWENVPWPNSLHKNFTGSVYYDKIDAVRATLTSRNGQLNGPWVPVADPYPAADLQVSVNEIERDPDTGFLVFDLDFSASNLGKPDGVCGEPWRACQGGVEARFESDDSVHLLAGWENVPWPNSLHKNFTGRVYYDKIDAVRATVTSREGSEHGPWVAVNDPYPDPELSVVVNSLTRNSKTGYLDYDVDLSVSGVALPDGVCGEPWRGCLAAVQARFESDDSVHTLTDYWAGVPWPNSLKHNFKSSAYYDKIDAVRAVISSRTGFTYGAWVSVKDPYDGPRLKVVVEKMQRDEGSNTLRLSLSFVGADYSTPDGPCPNFGWCNVNVQARQAGSGDVSNITSSTGIHLYPGKANWVGSVQIGEIDAVRARVTGEGPAAYGKWVKVSENINDGHDLDQSYALALAAVGSASALEACYVAFSIGTHTKYHATATDQHLDCTAAVGKGSSFPQFLKSYMGTLSGKGVAALLVSLGVAEAAKTAAVSPNLDYNKLLPPGCRWLSYEKITCEALGVTTDYRPISAPPAQDGVWRQNQAAKGEQKRQESGQPADDIPPRVIVPGDVPQPLDTLTPMDMDVILAEQCAEYLAVWGAAAGLDDDSCDTLPIFGTGQPNPEAARHDYDAIAANPTWFALSYMTNAEKAAAGWSRADWVSAPECLGSPATQQCDEYPFYAAAEGHPATRPDLRPIDATQNMSQGALLSAWARFKCPQLTNPATLGTADREFLVVPIPDFPTWTRC